MSPLIFACSLAFAQDPAPEAPPTDAPPAEPTPAEVPPAVPVVEVAPEEAPSPSPIQLAERPEGLGVGVLLGAPTGLSVAYRFDDPRHAVAAGLAWSVSSRDVQLHLDYQLVLQRYESVEVDTVDFPLYIGVGARFRAGDSPYRNDPNFGLRVPFGVAVHPKSLPIEGFVEVAPIVGLFPDTTVYVDAGFGVRVYFGVNG
ncbi:MAG: hypothetical protein IPO67_05240 [Deltaproteobacteria bacterium]|nr:hypothetical protein [Deltaproteobacteria bacterium]